MSGWFHLDRYTEMKLHTKHVLVLTHTHTYMFACQKQWSGIMDEAMGVVGRFYHSHSLNHQPSAKCTLSCLCVCGSVCTCVRDTHIRIWMDQWRTLRAWTIPHFVKLADLPHPGGLIQTELCLVCTWRMVITMTHTYQCMLAEMCIEPVAV